MSNDESTRTCRTISSTDFDLLLSCIKKYINRLRKICAVFFGAWSTSDLWSLVGSRSEETEVEGLDHNTTIFELPLPWVPEAILAHAIERLIFLRPAKSCREKKPLVPRVVMVRTVKFSATQKYILAVQRDAKNPWQSPFCPDSFNCVTFLINSGSETSRHRFLRRLVYGKDTFASWLEAYLNVVASLVCVLSESGKSRFSGSLFTTV